MEWVYVLQSKKDNNFYVGLTQNLNQRFKDHNLGKVPSTSKRTPLKLIYGEFCVNRRDAARREKYLKTAWGKRYIKIRLSNYLTG